MRLHRTEKCPLCKGKGTIPKVMPEALRAARHKAGKTLEQMGKRLGFTKMYLSDIETGRRVATPYVVAGYKKL